LPEIVRQLRLEDPRHPVDEQVETAGETHHIKGIRRAFKDHGMPITAAGSTLDEVQCIKRQNYPEIKMLQVQEPRGITFFGTRTVERGAWRIGSYTLTIRGDDIVDNLHLLSDGKSSLSDLYASKFTSNILNGLRNLKKGLQA